MALAGRLPLLSQAAALSQRLLTRAAPPSCLTSVRHRSRVMRISAKERRRRRREAADMSWAEPLLAFQRERQARAAEDEAEAARGVPASQPHMLHAIWRIKPLKGRPWWERDIIKRLGLDGHSNTPVIQKNIPSVNAMLADVKHLVRVEPLTFPHGVPEDESDLDHAFLRSSGQMFVQRRLAEETAEDAPRLEAGSLEEKTKWQLKTETVRKELDRIRVNHEIHTEYHKTNYVYKHNQDNKEWRYSFNKDVPEHQY